MASSPPRPVRMSSPFRFLTKISTVPLVSPGVRFEAKDVSRTWLPLGVNPEATLKPFA